MGNLFCSKYSIHRRFDLKGSSHGRTMDKHEGEIDETTTLKDLDLNFVFQLQKFWFDELIRQINLDCKFLEREGIMDYSLLVGLHFRDDDTAAKMGMLQFVIPFSRKGLRLGERGNSEYCFLESRKNMDPVLACRLG